VGNKINKQMTNWRNSGYEVRLFMHTQTNANTETLLEGEVFNFSQINGVICREYKRISALPNGKKPPNNLQFHGFLARDTMREFFRKADAAISSMALHRIQKIDATPLKTLEYLAYGIPVILPYQDANLKDLEADFLLHIPDNETNIVMHAEEIQQFAWQMRGKRAPRYVIAPYIDSTIKEKERLGFFEKIIWND
jgi:glycosyltransferase involved in cell wall biosynthesis